MCVYFFSFSSLINNWIVFGPKNDYRIFLLHFGFGWRENEYISVIFDFVIRFKTFAEIWYWSRSTRIAFLSKRGKMFKTFRYLCIVAIWNFPDVHLYVLPHRQKYDFVRRLPSKNIVYPGFFSLLEYHAVGIDLFVYDIITAPVRVLKL